MLAGYVHVLRRRHTVPSNIYGNGVALCTQSSLFPARFCF